METRLGTALLRAGRITQQALDEALEVQVTSGGRLGSVLVALGTLDEDALASILANHHGLPVVDRTRLDAADPRLFGDFNRDFAAFHQVVCLAVEGRTVEVAMVDPGDVTAREVVEQRTRRRLSIHVVPERLFWEFASRHYGLDRPQRSRPRGAPSGDPAVLTENGYASPLPSLTPDPGGKADARHKREQQENRWETTELVARSDAELLATVVSADLREEIAHALEVWGGRQGAAFATLVIQRQEARGWVAVVDGAPSPDTEALTFDLDGPSLFREVLQQRQGYQGVPPRGPTEATFFDSLGRAPPREMLLLPVVVQGRVVNLIYLDGARDPLPRGALGALEQVAEALAATYLRLILTRRARSQGER